MEQKKLLKGLKSKSYGKSLSSQILLLGGPE
jgi:hypothetical protein